MKKLIFLFFLTFSQIKTAEINISTKEKTEQTCQKRCEKFCTKNSQEIAGVAIIAMIVFTLWRPALMYLSASRIL